ncbi:MAG: response regulator [Rhodanobacter sp.]
MSTTILIVEDESDLSGVMADYVSAAGYEAEVIADGRAALARIQQELPSLIVLDLMLPGLDGLSLCKAVRAFSQVPIIMVTARVQEIDRLLGLETGADDYLCKPFSPRELVARIKAVLRRSNTKQERTQLLDIDVDARTARIRTQLLDLTATEFSLLAAMAKRTGTIFSRAQLLDLASRDNFEVTDRAIDSHIKNLRRKLAAAMPDAEVIHSVYGLGYRVDL